MHRSYLSALVGLLLLVPAGTTVAQFRDQGIGFGASFGGTMGQTELRDRQPDFLVRGFMRYSIIDALQGEFGIGAGYVRGEDYRTQVFPIDYRLQLAPLPVGRFNPFVYGGAGVINYNVEEPPGEPSVGPDDFNGWTPYVPAGAGFQFLLSDVVALEASGGYNWLFTDKMNAYVLGENDAYWNAGIGLTVIGEGGSWDPDGDGLTNDEEKQLGTDRKKADTDGDGLMDGAEVKTHNTNPLAGDSDGDTLGDAAEIQTHRTDPNKADTDGDTLADGEEVNTTKTDPLKADTDGDGLSDAEEVKTTKTDPLKSDTDGDTLSDSEELNRHRTNPLKADTDGGTVADNVEIGRGTDPLVAEDDVKQELKVEVGAPIILEGVTFETGKAEVTAASDSILQLAYNTLFQNPEIAVEIRGYTDNTGRKDKNLKLSQERADAVKMWLVGKGIAADRITTMGFGPENPIAPNTTRDGKAKNRRIEFVRTR